MVCVRDFFHFEYIPICISCILFSNFESTIIFVETLLALLIIIYSFVANFVVECFDGLNQPPSILSYISSVFTDHKSGLSWSSGGNTFTIKHYMSMNEVICEDIVWYMLLCLINFFP